MTTLMESIEDKYAGDEEAEKDYGFIVFVSNSPECKKGMFPPIMTLSDYDIERVGCHGISKSKLSHIMELDLTDNLLADWSEILLLLKMFPSLEFFNLSNNLLCQRLSLTESQQASREPLPLRKLVLHGNKIDWTTINELTKAMPVLEELHLSNNSMTDPDGSFSHDNLRQLFLTCNNICNFDAVHTKLGKQCPNLELLSLGECPLTAVPEINNTSQSTGGFRKLFSLNLSTTKISEWSDIDNLRTFPSLTELRIRNCPILEEYTAHERRMLLVARLPNVLVLNGGDRIPDNEREDAERGFIRFYLDEKEQQPKRYHELVAVHGQLDPLVNVSMEPATHVRVKICYKEDQVREEVISVYQTVQQFKTQLNLWFKVPTQNIKLFYCDQVLVNLAGPEEMKWSQKALYTYNVHDGDRFIVDEKVPLTKLKTNRGSSGSLSGISSSPKIYGGSSGGQRTAIQFAMSPRNGFGPFRNNTNFSPKAPQSNMPRSAAGVARNLFGRSNSNPNNGSSQN